MLNTYKNIFHNLSTRRATILCFTVALLSRFIVLLQNISFSGDRALQAVAAKNLIEGRGYSINNVLTENIFEQAYTPLLGWPPGYSLLLSFFYLLTQHIMWSIVLLDAFSIVVLLYFSRKILRTVGCSTALSNTFTLLQGFFLYDFTTRSSSDLNALSFLVATVSMLLLIIKEKRTPLYYGAILAILNFFVPFLRYMYIPTIFILPSYLYFWSKGSENKRIVHIASLALALSGILLAGLIIFQKTYTGSPAYVYPFPVGFHPENLLRTYPVTLTAFFDVGFYSTIADKLGIAEYGKFNMAFYILNCIALFILCVQFVRFYFKKRTTPSSTLDHYVYIGSIYCLVIFVLLAALSLRYGGTPRHNFWTYVQEGRYWCFATFFLQQLAFIFLFHRWQTLRKLRWRVFGWVLGILLFLEASHGLYFSTKTALGGISFLKYGESAVEYYSPMKLLVRATKNNHLQKPTVFVSDVNEYLHPLRIMNEKTIFTNMPVDTSFWKTDDKVTVFIINKTNTAFLSSVAQSASIFALFEDENVHIFSTQKFDLDY